MKITTTRMRYAVVLLLALVALVVLGRRPPRDATISFTPSQSYLVILGVGGKNASTSRISDTTRKERGVGTRASRVATHRDAFSSLEQRVGMSE
jgi:hypothetical protein